MKRLAPVALCLLFAFAAQAAHITDKLVVGLYADGSLQGEPSQLLTSGTPVEVLERGKGAVQVRLADDSRGWVEAGYVTEEKPARMMLLEAQAEIRQLKKQLANAGVGDQEAPAPESSLPSVREERLKDQLAQAGQRIAELQQAGEALAEAQRRIAALEQEKARLDRARELLGVAGPEPASAEAADGPAAGQIGPYLPWIGGGLALLIGFGAGVGFIDYRIRKRYGGFRI